MTKDQKVIRGSGPWNLPGSLTTSALNRGPAVTKSPPNRFLAGDASAALQQRSCCLRLAP
jgi:hypothetical protein